MAKALPIVVMRGGTSRGIFIRAQVLPPAPERDKAILRLFGSPDPRQIDGLGGADLLTSKVILIGPPSVPGADIDYTFGQVGIDLPVVDWVGDCGNLSAGVAAYAVDEGYIRADDGVCHVRMHNTNTGQVLIGHVEVKDGRAGEEGPVHIDGVPGTGAPIRLDYSRTTGPITGKLLPTGAARDTVELAGIGQIDISVVDFANPVVYALAGDVGLTGIEEPGRLAGDRVAMDRLELVRGAGAVRFGLADTPENARDQSPNMPTLSVLAAPLAYRATTDGRLIDAEDVDIVGRMYTMCRPHRSYSGTGLANLGAAAVTAGTLVADLLGGPPRGTRTLRVGHPCGVAELTVRTGADGALDEVGYVRTARRLLVGEAYI
ncbi:PrpF domain-containing protein [Phytohabitans suffuscus]|uniref:Methylitaconate delta2-delta3-isomerase n=1 Tax=Phytohabitans suffuscus TaxID=624315 RepID=A0A6F8YEJ3_9ACTN|nr:PrpF domain-containing protein [Phytohabitans suffuscus]BCB84522.1 methylitaconate delta2-delta3-isomerase [Phytohabitans suffuscus]